MSLTKSLFGIGATEVHSKVVQLKNLKCHGTLMRHKSPETPVFLFNSFNLESNPLVDVHESDSLKIQLVLAQDTCYLPGMFSIQESCAATTSTVGRSALDQEMLLQSRSVFTGAVIITVKGCSGVLFQDLKVQLSGYSSEFVCLTQFGERVVRLLKEVTEEQSAAMMPMIRDTIHFETKLTLLSPGTYTYPFNFVLDPYNFHASIGTHLGSTQYRVEFSSTVMKQKGHYETIFLSKAVTVKKTLPPGNLLKYDCVESRGTWRNGLLDYEIYLSTKLIEFDQPFQFHLNLLKSDVRKLSINHVEVILEQNILIPCVKKRDLNLEVPKSKSYMVTNMFLLDKRHVGNGGTMQHLLQFSELVVSSTKQSIVMSKSLYPYYCEVNDSLGSERCKLKITHVLKAQISLKLMEPGSKSINMLICLKLPVILVDQDMSSSLHLPPYEECNSEIYEGNDAFLTKTSTSLSAATTNNDPESPPSYNEIFDAYSSATSSTASY
ncbi:HER042Cp [Eremothecium sinecaudum]|uniref:HER042Cp n=1 Tax=Eremothecium sinecaudum TaxID=45286 RepID=A0A0X8HTT0_9SACH|nr:HER042Cp [Eremothecium sinecaudum]AMD21321.1 HER042Cp [Eremothecium sinecaudum]